MALKIAYMCMCHIDPDFGARAAKALKYEQDGIFIHVDNKVDIAPFKVGGTGFPYFCSGEILFNRLPGGSTDLAVPEFFENKKQIQRILFIPCIPYYRPTRRGVVGCDDKEIARSVLPGVVNIAC